MNALKSLTLSLLVTAGAIAAACAPAAMAAESHSHGAAAPAKLRLDHGRKWGTDAPLREGMTRIRTMTAAQVAATHAGKATPEQYAALAAGVELEVGRIVANCKLPPEADAVLHVIVSDLMAGTGALAGKSTGAKGEQGLVQVATAVNNYGRHFQHPGFRPIALGH